MDRAQPDSSEMPILADFSVAADGELTLITDQGDRWRVDVGAGPFEQAYGKPLRRLCDAARIQVYSPRPTMDEQYWGKIRRLLSAEQFDGHEGAMDLLALSAAELSELPLRIYAGNRNGTELWLQRQCQFWRHPTEPYEQGAISSGVWFWHARAYLRPLKSRVEVEGGAVPGHWVGTGS